MELRNSVVRGVAWSTVEKVLSAVLQMAVSLVLLSMLAPADYGAVAVITAIIGILMPLIDSGFSQALIRQDSVSDTDYSSVFYLNIGISLILYALLALLAPAISGFYGIDVLRTAIPVLGLLLPINALSIIQNTIFSRSINFKKISLFTLCGSVVSAVVAIWMARAGYGLWALVGQRLTSIAVKTVMLWGFSAWRPALRFSMDSIRRMFGYGSMILLSDIVTNVYYQVSNLFIGKIYTVDELGYYDRGNKVKELPVTSMILSVMGVAFSALSRLQDSTERLFNAGRKIYLVWAFVMYPSMVGLICCSRSMFSFLLPDVWMPAVPYLRILCIAGLFSPLSVLSYVLIKVRSDGRIIFRTELVKKTVATLVLVLTIPVGVRAIAWGQVAIFLSDMLVNAYTARHLMPEWKPMRMIAESYPYALLTCLMGAVILAVDMCLPLQDGWLLLIEVLLGCGLYLGIAEMTGLMAWSEIKSIVGGYLRKLRGDGADTESPHAAA